MRSQCRMVVYMNRRDFLLAASAAAGGTAAATGTAAAQQGNASGGGKQTAGGGANKSASGNKSAGKKGGKKAGGKPAAGGVTKTVKVGPGGNFVFAPEDLYIKPGTKVKFVWKSNNHNVHPKSGKWGHLPLENKGFSYTTPPFTKKGKHHYWCDPHKGLGMVGNIIVNSTGKPPGGGGGGEVKPEEMGVPFQPHYVGIAALLMMMVSLAYTFFLVKYGESPNAKGGD